MALQQAKSLDNPAAGAPPLPRTSLVGRSDDVADVLHALTESRVVTLTGPGGVGKTRMALATLPAAGDLAPGGTWWVELGGLAEPELVADIVAGAVGARGSPGCSPLDAAAERIGQAAALLVLDNCEHLAIACADVVDRLLDACPGLRVLVTSREPLGVVGECVWPVPPLSLPPAGDEHNLATVAGCTAAQLFEQRTRALARDFRITDDNAAAVARLCRRLDGLPLSIELAAARMRVLSVEQIAAGLDDAFRLLVRDGRTGPARHQTLRATLDWSHDLLTERERVVFRRLAIFPGGFDLAAAEHVAAGGGIVERDDVLDLLTRLADRSLVFVRRGAGVARYRLLATVRDYGRERLSAAGERDVTGRAHLEYYCELAERAEPLLSGPAQVSQLDRLEAEGNNLRAALAFARDADATVLGMRLAAALWRLCSLRGHYREGREWLDWAASADPHGPAALRAKALRGGGSLAFLQCDYPGAIRRLEASLRLYRELGDQCGVASVLQVLGSVAREQGRYADAELLHRESLDLFAQVDDRLGVAQARGYLGFASWLQENWQAATEHCAQALADFRNLGEPEGISWSLISLGTVAQYQGDHDRAARLLGEAHRLAETVHYPEGVAWSLHERGLLSLRRAGQDAEALLTASLARHRKLGDRWRTASVLVDLAAAVLARGAADSAVGLLAAAAAIREEIGTVIAPCELPDHRAIQERARAELGPDGFDAAWAMGRDCDLDDLLTAAAAERVRPQQPVPSAVGQSSPDPAGRPPRRSRPASSAALRIRVLGASTVHLDDRLLGPADWGYAKPRELLFFLASTGPRSKQQIGAALWPDLSGSQVRNAFHTALRDLRRAVGDPGWVVFAAGRYALDGSRDLRCDVRTFEEALRSARGARPAAGALPFLQEAVVEYRGDFLPDSLDADWVDERRAELARAFRSALAALGRLLVAAGDYPRALEIYRRATRQDPFDETLHRHLMGCLMRIGESAQAAHVYQGLRERLRDELGIAPAAETTALYRKLTVAH